jgi:hypothetical protein
MFDRLFAKRPRRSPGHPRQEAAGKKRRIARDRRLESPLAIQSLEQRLALTIDFFQYPVAGVTSGESSYTVLLMDDATNGFLKKNATPSPTFTYATNSQFLDDPATLALEAVTFAELPSSFGPMNSFYVTSGQRQIYSGPAIQAAQPGKTTTISNKAQAIDIGTSDGIIPGTFFATLSIVDSQGNAASARVVASKPGAEWNLSLEKVSGDGEMPTEGNVDALGNVTLRGWNDAPTSVDLRPVTWGVYTENADPTKALSFTVFAGQTVTQRLLVDLARNQSTISINSPVIASRGKGGDPAFFSGSGGVAGQVGQVNLYGSTIVTSADVSSSNLFTAGVPLSVAKNPIPVRNVTINRPLAAPKQQLILEGAAGAPGRLLVGEQGALADSLKAPSTDAANSLDVQAKYADVVFAGTVNASEQTYLLQSPGDPRPYSLTTVSPTSGVQAGRIFGGTVGVTLANEAGGTVDVRTQVDNLRMTASATAATPVLPYAIRVAEADDLVVDAVPASQRAIAITTVGTLTLIGSIETSGDVALEARNNLKLLGPVSSATGNVSITSDSVTASSVVTAGGTRGVTFTALSATGDVDVNALVRAGGPVKQPVRAATVATITLSGVQTVDGIVLNAGDRVLVKNQATPSQNGIYIVNTTGPWSRASDANLASLFTPGFTVYAVEGSQEGGWVFANPANPSLGTTGLLFVPVSATQAYAPVAAATTTGSSIVLSGLQTVDAVALAAGQRVLVKNQANPRQNGIYVVSTGAWQRAGDADTAAELRAGSYVFVGGGTENGSKGFVLDDDAVQVGLTPLTFSAFTVESTRTKAYTPANVLPSVVAATTASIDLSVAQSVIDGQALATDDLVLVKNQFDAASNGVYQVQAGGLLVRWSGASSSGQLARGTTVFVTGGTVNAATSWTFNDTLNMLGTVTAASQVVTGLASTSRLVNGMLVAGPGIQAGTTITNVLSDTSVLLSKPVTLSDPSAALSFLEIGSVTVDTTPIVFVPTGGNVVVTAGQSITSTGATPTSRLQGATALLSASRPRSGAASSTSTITSNTDVGRLSASAPGAVTIDNASTLDLVSVGTTTAGPIAVTASGTLTALAVAAAATSTTPGGVTLLSRSGNVVAAGIASTRGDISLTAATGDVRVTPVGSYQGAVSAQAGSIFITANRSPGESAGDIVIDGQLAADGTNSDAVLKTSNGALRFTSNAVVSVKNQLLINTPEAPVVVDPAAQIAASRLSLTAQFGASQSPPAALGSYQALYVNRTDNGDISYTSAGNLTVEGAVTKKGSIAFTAPSLTVAALGITAGTVAVGDGNIDLTATAGNLIVSASLTALNDTVRLAAPAGTITQTAGTIAAQVLDWTAKTTPTFTSTNVSSFGLNLTGPGNLSLGTSGRPITVASASTSDGNIAIVGSNVVINGLVNAGGSGKSVSVNAGGTIGFQNAGRIVNAAGTVSLTSGGAISASNTGSWTSVAAGNSLTISAGGATTLSTDVATLAATVTAGGLNVTEKNALALASLTATGQNVSLTVGGALTQTGAIKAASLAVTSTAGAVSLSNTGNDVTSISGSTANGNFTYVDANGFTVAAPGITAGTAASGDGNIDLTATTGNLTVSADLTALNDAVRLAAPAGTITQTAGTITAQSLDWTAKGAPTFTSTNVSSVGVNLTSPGDLTLGTAGQPITVASASTSNGNISIVGSTIQIIGLVSAGGSAKSVSVNAGGTIGFQGNGRIVNAAGPVSLTSAGTLAVSTITAGTTLTVTTTGGGGLDVGPLPNALLKANGTLDLRGVQGQIVVRNNGQIQGSPVLLPPGQGIQAGGPVSTPADLVQMVAAINALPAIPGSRYEIIVTASMTLTQTLTVNRPVEFRGTSQSVTITGSPTVKTGLVLNSTAGGSVVRDLTFANFAGDAIRLNSTLNATVNGVAVRNSGFGITLNGTSTGTKVQGNVLDRNATGVRLLSATGALVGGSAAGQGNTISNARVGVFASGFCTRSQVVRNRITGTLTPYDVRSSRNLTVVR